jgi:putative transcriptional regulator
MVTNKILAKNIAGDIVLSEEPGVVMKKWRQVFMIKQCDLAGRLEVTSSVISDYECGRRRSPGTYFVRRFIETLISADMEAGGAMIQKLAEGFEDDAIMDIREFLEPVTAKKIIAAVNGEIIVGEKALKEEIWGYTVIDSIKAILELSELSFMGIYGERADRALIFTKVHLGRSPLIAVKVTHPKPRMIVLHGLSPKKVDKLAVKIAAMENIMLVVSKIPTEDALIRSLRENI